jgi:hypothetical protein
MAQKKAKQRFVDLCVREVSLVDRPANEQEFLVIKRHPLAQSETEMANVNKSDKVEEKKDEVVETEAEKAKKAFPPKGSKADDAEDAADGGADEDQEEGKKKAKKSADDLAEAEKALADAQAKVEAMKAKAPPFPKKDDEKDAKEEKAKKSDTQEVAKGNDAQSMLCRMMLDDMHSRLYKLETLMSMDFEQLMSTAKSMGASPEKLAEIAKAKESEVAVEKGKKQFNDERTAKINDAIKNLLDIAKDVSPDKLAEMLKGMLPAGAAPEKGGENSPKPALDKGATTPDANGMAAVSALKAEDIAKAVKDALAPLAEKVEAVTKRVEEVATVRGVTKSLSQDGTEKPVEKSGNLWTGIL